MLNKKVIMCLFQEYVNSPWLMHMSCNDAKTPEWRLIRWKQTVRIYLDL